MHFKRHAPVLLCSNVPAARDFYARHLGLTVNVDLGWFVDLKQPQPAAGPQVAAPLAISLYAADHATLPAVLRRPTAGLVLALEVDDANAEHVRLAAAGVELISEPIDEPWGQRHFFVAAPDGVALDIFQPITPDPAWLKANGFA